jgi:uroporphyrinogen decarboxylase
VPDESDIPALCRFLVDGFTGLGYDYAIISGGQLKALDFPKGETKTLASKSLNEGYVITCRQDFERYSWPDPDSSDYTPLNKIRNHLSNDLKIIISGNGGIFENVVEIVGYENLCYRLYEQPDLVRDIVDFVGSRMLRYYENIILKDAVGAIILNDDWGFKHQTLINPKQLRKYIFPWHRQIVEMAHQANKPAILHSCGNLADVMDDVINNLKFDGKHSFEDLIIPVEEAYELWGSRIAIMGGIDMDYLCRKDPLSIRQRVRDLITLSREKGGLALGSGNSIPDFIPVDNYCAMLETILFAE